MILLLGASGLLGHNVLRLLLERRERVRVLLRPGSELLIPASEVLRGSLLNPSALLQAATGCDAIINCAGTTDMGLRHLEDYFPVNRDLPAQLCRVMDETGIRTLVHTSTANTIAPGTLDHPTDESAPFAAPFDRSYYAISKLEGEKVLLDYAAGHPDRHIVVVNPGFMVGPYDPKPSSGKLLLAGFNKKIMAAPCGGKSFLHVQDAATAICNALKRGENGRYLLTGESLTLKEFYALQAHVCGYRQAFLTLPKPLVRLAGRFGDLLQRLGARTVLCTRNTDQLLVEEAYDCTRAERDLGLPHTPVAVAIRDFYAWQERKSE